MVRPPSSSGLSPARAVIASLCATALMPALCATASAQDVPVDPANPPIAYSLPPGQSTPTPTPTQPPPPTPTPVPSPPPAIVVPTPARSPAPVARATPRAAPRPVATTPAPAPAEAVAPIEMAPTAAAPALPPPAPSPTAAAVSPPAATAPAAPGEGGGWTWWVLAGGLALVAAAALLAWRRRDSMAARPADEGIGEAAAPEAPPEAPVDLAPTPPMRRAIPAAAEAAPADAVRYLTVPARQPPPPVPDGTIKAFQNRPPPPPAAADPGFVTAFRSPPVPAAPMLALDLQPIRAGCTEDAGFVEYTFAVLNPSDVAVGEMLVSAWLISANAAQDEQLLSYLAEPADPSRHNVFSLKPGEHRELRASMGLPFDQLHLVEAAGRRFFAPMLLLDARYRSQHGAPGRTSAAFMIGRPHASNGKLAPVFVDRGPRVVEGLAARPYRLPRG